MKKIQYWTIILFCIALLLGGGMTILKNGKTIAFTVIHSIKDQYTAEPSGTGLVSGFTEGMEESVTDNFWLKELYVDLYGLTEKLLGRDYIRDANPSNVVVKDQDKNLHFITFPFDYEQSLNSLVEVSVALKQEEIPLLFVQTPLKVIEDYTTLPPSVVDYSRKNTDDFLSRLEENNIDFIDLRESVKEDGLDLSTLFFKTDHHWRTETAFWATDKVAEILNERYNLDLNQDGSYTDLASYNQKVYEKFFLGSQGRRVGRLYAGVDDYTLITPKFDTDYEVTINKSDSSTTYTGTFEETILKQGLLDEKESVYTNRYASYFGGDYPEVIIKNKLQAEGKKVLIVKDSFALPFSAFLSTMFEETRMIDTRYFKEGLLNYIEDYQPDVVLYVYKSMKTIQ